MRVDVGAAFAMGIGLPLLEASRRRTNLENFHGYVDDFIIGALLLYAAYAVTRSRRHGPVLLAVAWAMLCGGLYGSFFWQLFNTEAQDVGGLANHIVVIIKGILYAVALVGLRLSSRAAIRCQGAV